MNTKAFVAVVATVIVAVGAVIFVVTSTSKEEQPVVRIGYLPLTANVPLFVAIEKGFFQEAGLKIEPLKFESSNQMVEALVSGRIDVETAASSSVVATVGQKLADNICVFMLNAFSPDNYLSSLLVKTGSTITSPKDLEGKKIGTFPGSTMRMYTEMVLESLKVKPGEIIQLTPPNQLGALDSGAVDALLTLEPTGTLGEVKGLAVTLVKAPVETYVLNPWVAGTNSFSAQFLKTHPNEAVKVRDVLYRAVDYIRANPVEAKKTMTKYTPVTDESLASRLTVPDYWKLSEMRLDAFQKMADGLLSHGEIDTKVDVSSLIMKK